jgi:hypothetical protein
MRHRRVPVAIVLALLVLISTVGCHKSVTPHPNQLSDLDGQVYDRLTEAQAALDAAKAQYAAGKLPQTSTVKSIINGAGAAYETTRTSWVVYRDILQGTASGDAAAAQLRLQQNMTEMAAAIVKVVQLTGGKP